MKKCVLGDGVVAEIVDATTHYFGGYYHVKVEVHAELPLSSGEFEDSSCHEAARLLLGDPVLFVRELERMAVPGPDVETVRFQLVEAFEQTMLPYLSHPDFPGRFIRSQLAKAVRPSPRYGH